MLPEKAPERHVVVVDLADELLRKPTQFRRQCRGEPAGRLRIGGSDPDFDDRGVHLARGEAAQREH